MNNNMSKIKQYFNLTKLKVVFYSIILPNFCIKVIDYYLLIDVCVRQFTYIICCSN